MSTSVELHIPDFTKAKEYYSKLDFNVRWERVPSGAKGYLVLTLESNVLCFWGGNDGIYNHRYFGAFPCETARGLGVEIVIHVKDIKTFYERVRSQVDVFQELKLRPWGLLDFRVIDPFGFYLRVTEEHDITDPRYAVP